jgi:hypothetical protein
MWLPYFCVTTDISWVLNVCGQYIFCLEHRKCAFIVQDLCGPMWEHQWVLLAICVSSALVMFS